jgi:hypothetical protein
MLKSMRRRNGRVQEALTLEDIVDGVLCLRGGHYRAVLEVESLNFALKSDEEAEAIMASYRAFLNALSYPIQVLVRILPSNLDAYLDGLRERMSSLDGEQLRRLALEHETFVRGLARERSLLERRFYLVVPAGLEGTFERGGLRWPWQKRATPPSILIEAASRQLASRCQELMRGLASCGIGAWVLGSEELAALWGSILRGDMAHSTGSRF